jgi:hypothetical protein
MYFIYIFFFVAMMLSMEVEHGQLTYSGSSSDYVGGLSAA